MINTSVPDTNVKNPYLIKSISVAKSFGYTNLSEFISVLQYDTTVPACCKSGCEVALDGYCQHGCPSIILTIKHY
jgi:hypothetical protein